MSLRKSHSSCQMIVRVPRGLAEQIAMRRRNSINRGLLQIQIGNRCAGDRENRVSGFVFIKLKFAVNAARQTCITTSWLGVRSDLASGTGNTLGMLPDSVLAPSSTETI
jgi:hypothetical protein